MGEKERKRGKREKEREEREGKRRKREKKEDEERKQFNRGETKKKKGGVFVAWEVLAGQAQGGAYHYRQDIPVTSVGHPLRGSPVGRNTRCPGGLHCFIHVSCWQRYQHLIATTPCCVQSGRHLTGGQPRCFMATRWQHTSGVVSIVAALGSRGSPSWLAVAAGSWTASSSWRL